ncbi:MAG: hypothetical protein WBD66_04890, partial [Candidatus Acidiferrales bacterium]
KSRMEPRMEQTSSPNPTVSAAADAFAPGKFESADVEKILRRNGWLASNRQVEPEGALAAWIDRAALLIGTQSQTADELEDLLRAVFEYDAVKVMQLRENQAVLMREGAREVIRELANRVLEGGDIESDRLKEIVEALKIATPYRSRELFQPIRVALAGRAGEGGLDRVILLLDAASRLDFASPVKSARQRMIEFCAALD